MGWDEIEALTRTICSTMITRRLVGETQIPTGLPAAARLTAGGLYGTRGSSVVRGYPRQELLHAAGRRMAAAAADDYGISVHLFGTRTLLQRMRRLTHHNVTAARRFSLTTLT